MANFTGLDLTKLREHPPEAEGGSPSRALLQRPVTRRLIVQAGVFGAAIPTAFANVGPIFRRFHFAHQDGRALFYLGRDLRWAIDPERFAGRPRLRVEESPKLIEITLRNARFPGTPIPADLHCRCEATAFGWWIDLRMELLGFRAGRPLESWLEGAEPLRSTSTAGARLISSRTAPLALALQKPARMDFFPTWRIGFSGRESLALRVGQGGEVSCGSAVLSLPEPGEPGLSAAPARKRSRIDLVRGGSDGSSLNRAWTIEDGELAVDGDALEELRIEADETPAGRRLFFLAQSRPGVEAGRLAPGPGFQSGGEPLILRLAGVRLAGAFEPAGSQVAVLADLHGEAPWLDGPTTRLKLGNPAGTTAFELVERDGQTERLALAPALVASVAALDGALGLEMHPPVPTRLALLAKPGEAPVPGPCGTAGGCGQRPGIEVVLPDLCFSVLRPADLLRLGFQLHNLRLRDRWFCKPWLERIDRTKPAYLVVCFPPQHVAERAFLEDENTSEPPNRLKTESRLAGESRLAFRLKDTHERLDFDLPTLLNWDPEIFEPSLVPSVRDSRNEKIAPPLPLQTDIEFPWRLHLSPEESAVWKHSVDPVAHEERTELWHTRLSRAESGSPATVRAVWAEFEQPQPEWQEPPDTLLPFRSSLQDRSRFLIVDATHSGNDPKPVDARLLALSALGAWSDLYGEWPCNLANTKNPLERWHHVATLGRDQFVRVEFRGFLLPIGHRATTVIETRRQLELVDYVLDGQKRRTFIAFLRQRIFIKRKERSRVYGNWDMACQEIELLDEKTPNLNDPGSSGGGGLPKLDAPTVHWGMKAYWPTVGSQVFRFHLRGTDYAGNQVTWEMPLIFVEQSVDSQDQDFAHSDHLRQAARHYGASPRRVVPFSGQTLAMAPSLRKGDTEVDAETLTFDSRLRVAAPTDPCEPGYIPPDSEIARRYDDPCEPPFWPVLAQLQARVPAIASFLGTSQTATLIPRSITCDDAFESFASLAEKGEIQADFHNNSHRSGGVLGPSPDVSHLSRRFGPVGLPTPPTGGAPADSQPRVTTDGGTFFSPDATILGTLKLQDIIGILDPGKGDVPALLSLITPYADGPDLLEQSLNWSKKDLQKKDLEILAFLPTPGTELTLEGSLSVWIGQPDAVRFSMRGALNDFDVRIGWTSAGVLIHFNSLSYLAGSDGATGFDIQMGQVSFLGALGFIQKLAEQLQSLMGKKAGVEIDLQPGGVTVWMPPINFDQIEFGIFKIKNFNIQSWARLPFTPAPVEFGVSFGRRDSPCELSVGIFGGRAYMLAVLDTAHGGIRRFEAAFEFGALRDVSFGPAQGRVYILGGVFYSITVEGDRRTVQFAAYVRAGGSVDVLGLITAYIDLYIGLLYEDNGQRSYMVGEASLTIGFKIGFIEHSVTLRRTERLAGSATASNSRSGSAWRLASLGGALPPGEDCDTEQPVRFEDAMPFCEWKRYQAAFA